ncbi:hypothetical protein C6A88_00235, partial [Mycolicibacterium austroafricanum]
LDVLDHPLARGSAVALLDAIRDTETPVVADQLPVHTAAPVPAQQCVLEADRLRPAFRYRGSHREAQRPTPARAGGPGHR